MPPDDLPRCPTCHGPVVPPAEVAYMSLLRVLDLLQRPAHRRWLLRYMRGEEARLVSEIGAERAKQIRDEMLAEYENEP
jgi:hypothetical protein